jgi:8-oxo-dGTP diphosphatase
LALPGGHLEMYESWVECAIRETLEETGLHIGNLRFGHVTNDIMKESGKHYVTIFMMGEVITVEDLYNVHGDDGMDANRVRNAQSLRPVNLEPHKCDGWDSYSWEELRRFASFSSKSATDHPDHTMESGASEVEGEAGRIILFGPLLKLVEEAPSNVVDFITKTPNQHDL